MNDRLEQPIPQMHGNSPPRQQHEYYAQQQPDYAQQQQQQGYQYGLQQGQLYSGHEQDTVKQQYGRYEPAREQHGYSGGAPQAPYGASYGEGSNGPDALITLQSYNLQRQQEQRPAAYEPAASPPSSYSMPQAAPSGSPAGAYSPHSGSMQQQQPQGYGMPPTAYSQYHNNAPNGSGSRHGGSGYSYGSPAHGQQSPPPFGSMDSRSSNVFANGTTQNSGNVITDRRTTRVVAPPGGFSSFKLG